MKNWILIYLFIFTVLIVLFTGLVSFFQLYVYASSLAGTIYIKSLVGAVFLSVAIGFLMSLGITVLAWSYGEGPFQDLQDKVEPKPKPKKAPTPGIPLEQAQDELIASLPKFKGQAREMAVQLRKHGVSPVEIANILNKEGYTARNGKPFTGKIISQIIHYETKRKGKSTKKKEAKNEQS